jgi:selenocysteine lyase/cysteine desulfurase
MTGRKFLRAPRGTGMLYVRRELQGRLDPPGIDATSADWIDGDRYEPRVGSDRLEEFEASIAARVGLANALVEARALGIEAIHDRTAALAERLRRGLLEIDGVTVEDGEAERSAIVTFRVHGGRVDASTVIGAAAGADITINSSTAPWARLDMTRRHLDEVVRASPHYYNTNDELDRLLGVVAAVSSGTRRT